MSFDCVFEKVKQIASFILTCFVLSVLYQRTFQSFVHIKTNTASSIKYKVKT